MGYPTKVKWQCFGLWRAGYGQQNKGKEETHQVDILVCIVDSIYNEDSGCVCNGSSIFELGSKPHSDDSFQLWILKRPLAE